MINTKDIIKIIECSVLTGFIKNKDRGINIVLIANAESGKSEIIDLVKHYPQTLYTNDLSQKPLIEEILPKFERDEISHILIPDFITPLSHRRSSEVLIPILNNLLAEGIKDLKFYGNSRVFSKSIKGNLITAITKEIFDKKIISMRDNGFLSRIIPVTYKYSYLTQEKIHNSIKKGEYHTPLKLERNFTEFKLNTFKVEIPEDIGEKLEILSRGLVNQNKHYSMNRYDNDKNKKYSFELQLSEYGFRFHKQLRVLLQGICLYNTKKPDAKEVIVATDKDFKELAYLTKFMNFDFTEI